jgi:hypothetical protein
MERDLMRLVDVTLKQCDGIVARTATMEGMLKVWGCFSSYLKTYVDE